MIEDAADIKRYPAMRPSFRHKQFPEQAPTDKHKPVARQLTEARDRFIEHSGEIRSVAGLP
jgi:hypothetical protein